MRAAHGPLGFAAVALVVSIALTQPAGAAVTNNTFAPTGHLRPGGHAATVGIVIGCDAKSTFEVDVTVHQGPVAVTGSKHGRCTGAAETYPVVVTTAAGPGLAAGPAQICGDATTKQRGHIDDRHGWCRAAGITIEEAAP